MEHREGPLDSALPTVLRGRELATRWAKSPKVMEDVAWLGLYFVHAPGIVGRADEAFALADDMLDHIDPAWKTANDLRDSYLSEVEDRMAAHVRKSEFAAARAAIDKRLDVCRTDKVCASNIAVLYGNWSIAYQNQGDWQAARQKLQDCVATLPGNAACGDALKNLESRQRRCAAGRGRGRGRGRARRVPLISLDARVLRVARHPSPRAGGATSPSSV